MTIRIATYNAENLFRRPKVFELLDESLRKEVLDDFNELVSLLDRDPYQDADKDRIVALIEKHRAFDVDPATRGPIYVNQVRGGAKLFTASGPPANPVIKIVAKGRSKWAGWAELVRDDLEWAAVENTARVIAAHITFTDACVSPRTLRSDAARSQCAYSAAQQRPAGGTGEAGRGVSRQRGGA
jgi:hypothetical protein